MDIILQLWDIIAHLDQHLATLVSDFGFLTYFILFLIIFCETGLVVTPFLPGDSLLFAAGALTAVNVEGQNSAALSLSLLLFLLILAAILGDTVNYSIGKFLGPTLHKKGKLPLIKQKHLDKTNNFYKKYGKMTIILARFAPFIRTFAPFLAGVGQMKYRKFIAFNVIGGVTWVSLFCLAGHFFGSHPWVKKHFSVIILAIIIISITPMVVEFTRQYWLNKKSKSI